MIACDVKTSFQAAMTAHEHFPTACTPPVAQSHGPIQGPPPAEPEAVDPMPSDKWGMIEFFAKKACQPVELEREMMDVFAARQTLSRRLLDAAKRRDEAQAQQSAEAWIKSEMSLAKLFDRYLPHVQERVATLRNLGMADGG